MQVYKSYKPIVSIVLPTFNRAGLIERAINSVLCQTFKNWELIIVDDGSSDSTFEIINSFLMGNENIRYIKHSNRRPPLSFNAGMKASVGYYITFLGSDDEYQPDHIKLRVDFLNDNHDVDLIHGGVEIIGHPYVKDKNDITQEIHIDNCAVGGTFFGKRTVFAELNGFYNLEYSDDSDFLERAERAYNVKKVDWKTYIYYRDTPDSICTNIE